MSKYVVLNTVAGTAGDLTTPGQGRVVLTGDPKGFKRPDVSEIAVLPFINETLEVIRVTASAAPAANTTYSFLLEQEITGATSTVLPKRQALVSLTTGSSAPNATAFGVALASVVQGLIDSNQFDVSVAAHAVGNGGCDITALTGNATFRVLQAVNVAGVSQLASGSSTSTDFASSGTTLTMEVAATTAFAVGKLVRLSGWTGGALINGRTAAQGVVLRVSEILSGPPRVVFVAETVSAAITGQDTDYQVVASNARGLGSQYIANGITAGGSPSVPVVSTNVYHEVIVKGGEFAGKSQAQEDLRPIEIHYLISSTASAANALLLLARFIEVKNYYGAGVTTVDPLLLD
jgi:hypothetical protein